MGTKRKPVSIERLLDCAEVLQAWRDSLRRDLDRARSNWEQTPLVDLPDVQRKDIQTMSLIRALQVELLDMVEMHYLARRARKKPQQG